MGMKSAVIWAASLYMVVVCVFAAPPVTSPGSGSKAPPVSGAGGGSTTGGAGTCFTCAGNCAVAVGKYVDIKTDRTQHVVVDLASCKAGATISWVACRDRGTCSVDSCAGGTADTTYNKCQTTTSATFKVAPAQGSLTVQLHDGKAAGTVDCSGGVGWGVNQCSGGSPSSCGTITGVCQWALDITNIPILCHDDSDCETPGICGVATCVQGVCTNTYKPSSTVCRASVGTCDEEERCTGASYDCPVDSKKAVTHVCRASAGLCDVDETCDGASDDCPSDAFKAEGFVCRASAGDCDVDDKCSGNSAECNDNKQASTHVCRASAGLCDVDETCDGTSNDCPSDAFKAEGFVCRASAGDCDVDDKCSGNSAECNDNKQASTHVCRASAGLCDIAEKCDGSSNACPKDSFAGASVICRPASGDCDVAESCTGQSSLCPADAVKPSSTVCRAAVNSFDVAEYCTGSSKTCPADITLPPATVAPPSSWDGSCWTCSRQCAKIVSRSAPVNGFSLVTIDTTGCKNGATVSWIACRDGGCSLAECDSGASAEPSVKKCNEVKTATFKVPESQTSIRLQMHDGKIAGDVQCSGIGLTEGTCAGGDGTSCRTVSGVCDFSLDLNAFNSLFTVTINGQKYTSSRRGSEVVATSDADVKSALQQDLAAALAVETSSVVILEVVETTSPDGSTTTLTASFSVSGSQDQLSTVAESLSTNQTSAVFRSTATALGVRITSIRAKDDTAALTAALLAKDHKQAKSNKKDSSVMYAIVGSIAGLAVAVSVLGFVFYRHISKGNNDVNVIKVVVQSPRDFSGAGKFANDDDIELAASPTHLVVSPKTKFPRGTEDDAGTPPVVALKYTA